MSEMPVQGPISALGQATEAPESAVGQADEGTPSPVEAASPEASAEASQETTDAHEEPTFFDPKALSPELVPAYKQMQAAFTKKTQELAAQRAKVEAYDAFAADPAKALQQLAAQYGMTITKAEARAAVAEAEGEWSPQTWDEVIEKATEKARRELLQELAPVLETVKKTQAKAVETQLDELDPQWRLYEAEMAATLKEHPTLRNDISKLYRLSVPQEVWESRAAQAALQKIQARTAAAQGAGKSSVRRTAPAPKEVNTFAEAWAAAKEELASARR